MHQTQKNMTRCAIILLVSSFFIGMRNISTAENVSGISLSAGKTYTSGYYSDYFQDSWSFALGTIFEMPRIYDYLFAEANIIFDQRSMKESPDSYLRIYAIETGAGLFLPLWRYLVAYSSIGIQESYFLFHADFLDKDKLFFKPGAVFKAGFFIPLFQNISLRAGITHAVTEISEKRFYSTSFAISSIFRYPANIWSIDRTQERDPAFVLKENPDELFKNAMANIVDGDIEKAELLFKRVLEISPFHNESKEMLKKIQLSKESYQIASELIKENRYFDAIVHLEKSIPYVKRANAELNLARAKLLGEIPTLERRGIEEYEKKEYDRCIAIMNRIKTIDPNNATAAMYLPRAVRRKEAIERLK